MTVSDFLRRSSKLLLLASLVACGAPGSDAVFTKGNPKAGTADTARPAAQRPVRPERVIKQYSGLYRRLGEESRFQPCGTKAPLDITGTGEGRYLLAERFRWNAVWQGRAMFGVFQGAIVTDTLKPKGAKGDSAAVTTRTRFFITGVDSLRTWHAGDCGGMRVP